MQHTWTLTVGDGGCDGHCITRTEPFKSNYDLRDVVVAHETASKTFGLALDHECRGYENTRLSAPYLAKYREVFENNQIALDVLVDDWDFGGLASWFTTEEELSASEQADIDEIRANTANENIIHIGWPSYVEMYLQIAKLHISDLVWVSTSETKNNHDIGGYGLLSA